MATSFSIFEIMIINYKTHNTTEYNLSGKGFDKMDKILSGILMLIVWIITIVILGLLFAIPVMWMWNDCLVSAVTFAKPISLLQAWGINILAGILSNKSRQNSEN